VIAAIDWKTAMAVFLLCDFAVTLMAINAKKL
jgi:hypothetical protein